MELAGRNRLKPRLNRTDTFNVWFTEDQQRAGGIEYNYRREPSAPTQPADSADQDTQARGPVTQLAAMAGTDIFAYSRERPGMSAFVLDDGVVYHTYSTYARGLDGLWAMYQWLDRAPRGRDENGRPVAPPRRV